MKQMKESAERCGNCNWMRKHEVVQPLPAAPGAKNEGQGVVVTTMICHRYPTALKTVEHHWCGEWKEKEVKILSVERG